MFLTVIMSVFTGMTLGYIFTNSILHTLTCSIFGLVTGIFISLISFIISKITRNKYRIKIKILGILVSFTIVFVSVNYFVNPSSTRLFKKVVIDPIPSSVNYIQSSIGYSGMDSFCVIKFSLGKEDLDIILSSKPFIMMVDYNNSDDYLTWTEKGVFVDTKNSMYLFGSDGFGMLANKPIWWNLNDFEKPILYIAKIGEEHEQFIIYDMIIGEAYYFDNQW